MDNLTHSITGLATGELIHRALPAEPQAEDHRLRHRLLLTACALASNFPDLDLVLTPLLPDPLGAVLHHRGHTHTLLYALPQAFLLAALLWLLWPAARRLLAHSKLARAGLALALACGLVLHILMDYLNNYGVHPFHPFDSRWLYGDMVFIIEPVFWVAFGIPMIMAIPQRAAKTMLAIALAAVLLFFTVRGFMLWPSFAALAAVGVVLGWLQHRSGAGGKGALIAAALVALGFCGMQGYASQQAKQRVAEYALQTDPASKVLDIALNAFPANPLCWTFVTVESNEKTGLYRFERGNVSIAPGWLPAGDCPAGLAQRLGQGRPGNAISLISAEHGDLRVLRALARDNCHFNAWLRFARAPLVYAEEATDARFSPGLSGNFTTIHLDDFKNQPCSRYIPQWEQPRADLLRP
jgi:inner membrane protein